MQDISATTGTPVCCAGEALTFGPNPGREKTASRVKVLAALADVTRLGIVQMLGRLDEPMCVCDIQANFDLGQPTISHHLRVLREAGLVRWEKRGLWVYYSLNRETLALISTHLEALAAERVVLTAP